MQSSNSLRNCFLLSLVMHLSLGLFAIAPKDTSATDDSQKNSNIKITPKTSDKEIEVETISEDDLLFDPVPEKPKPTHLQDKCESYYGGIGITRDPFTGIISEVYEGYPADRNGLKVGMQILNNESTEQILGEIGTEVIVKYLDNDGEHAITIIRDKICTTTIKSP